MIKLDAADIKISFEVPLNLEMICDALKILEFLYILDTLEHDRIYPFLLFCNYQPCSSLKYCYNSHFTFS
jgi:hypothetical protein